MGSDITSKALRHQIGGSIKAVGQMQLAMLAAGKDPKDLDVGTVKGGKAQRQNLNSYVYNVASLHWQAIIPCNGLQTVVNPYSAQYSTKDGIEFKIRSTQTDVKRQPDCYESN
ncbi:hypothetical protein B2J93_8081 [Marssonina coronariae]|uniref:Uncharacterized protein n=1 Tax=Diplocarpon coronariae TaxID=2795749 RepID=A0A218ZB89_9HELO|nr:hypothetical protein B2J93_8081 [Marssonina coronariae]